MLPTISRKLNQLRQGEGAAGAHLEQEQECLVNKLMRKIEKLETETSSKQTTPTSCVTREGSARKYTGAGTRSLVNKLWKRMDKLESEKRNLQIRLSTSPVSEPPSQGSHSRTWTPPPPWPTTSISSDRR